MNFLARFKQTNEESDRPDFAGKILVVYCNSERIGGGAFQDARLVRIGFSEFVVGRRVELETTLQQRWSGVTVWIAIHEIAHMMVFDDPEAARKAFQSYETEVKTGSTSCGSDDHQTKS